MDKGELRWYGRILNSKFKEVQIVPISDIHYGNPLCSIKHFIRTRDFIRDNENAYTFLNGDLIEAIIRDSLGDVHTQEGTAQSQRDFIIDLLLPIQDKILGMVSGNHENRIYNKTGVDISKDIASALKIPYRPEGMLVKVIFGAGNNRTKGAPFTFWGYFTHGYGGARTKSAKAVKVERAAAWVPRADFIAMSHDHVVNVAPDVDLIPDNRGIYKDGFLSGRVSAHRKMLIKTNAYLKWGGYAERGGFPPSDLATPIILLLSPYSDKWKELPDKPRNAVKVIV